MRPESDPADGRAKLVWITKAARPVVEEMRRIATEVYAAALAGINPNDLDGLARSLQQIVADLETDDSELKEDVA